MHAVKKYMISFKENVNNLYIYKKTSNIRMCSS